MGPFVNKKHNSYHMEIRMSIKVFTFHLSFILISLIWINLSYESFVNMQINNIIFAHKCIILNLIILIYY